MSIENQPFMEQIDLFESVTEGYAQCRIPGMVITKRGTIIAYCEARDITSDWAKIDICMRRSFDGGKSWEDKRILVGGIATGNTINNPVMIASDDSDTVHFLYCMEYAECFYCRSNDDGNTWTDPVDITNIFNQFRTEYSWKAIATGPCHGIQTKNKRLVVPVWLALERVHYPSVVATIYSDNNGDTWNCGEILFASEELINPGETAIVELSDGRLMMNIRNASPVKRRAVTVSSSGYDGWTEPVFDEQLIDPACCGALARHNGENTKEECCILFSNCSCETDRKYLTIKGSWDNGKTWTVCKLLHEGGAAYSDLAVGTDGTIYCFYERFTDTEKYKFLTMARFNLQWLMQGN